MAELNAGVKTQRKSWVEKIRKVYKKVAAKPWPWAVFALALLSYVPIWIGAWQHPIELNSASYLGWLFLSLIFVYAFIGRGSENWRFPLGFVFGNTSVLLLAAIIEMTRHGTVTFDLGPSEMVTFFGIIMVGGIFLAHGYRTGQFSLRLLYSGLNCVDLSSMYPQAKQYFLAHEPMTNWGLFGWVLGLIVGAVSLVFVDQFPQRLSMKRVRYQKKFGTPKNFLHIFEHSWFSIDQLIFVSTMLYLMSH